MAEPMQCELPTGDAIVTIVRAGHAPARIATELVLGLDPAPRLAELYGVSFPARTLRDVFPLLPEGRRA